MKTALTFNNRPMPATVLLGIFLLSGMAALAQFQGGAHAVPVPQKKPALAMASRTQYGNFIDFSKALTFFSKSEAAQQKPVGSGDVFAYREIFDLQAEGKMAEADAYMGNLKDKRLMGHVLHQRYTHPDYKTSFNELKTWLDAYASEPGAERIYKLAVARTPKGYKGGLQKPKAEARLVSGPDNLVTPAKVYKSKHRRSSAEIAKASSAQTRITSLIGQGSVTNALEVLMKNPSVFDRTEFDQLRARIAAAYMYEGFMDKAYEQAVPAAHRSGVNAPLAGWVAGMAAWKNGRYAEAAKFFEQTAASDYSSGWLASAGAFWAARSYGQSGNARMQAAWLGEAGKHPRTFYGLIANNIKGRHTNLNGNAPTFSKGYYEALMGTSEGSRAMTLVAAGQYSRAETELLKVSAESKDLREAILAYASYASLPTISMTLGNALSDDTQILDKAMYPRLPWQPSQGYKVDPALINAIARQESRFDPSAESPAGAQGLMQLMPTTAAAFAAGTTRAILDPETNLEIGQRYVRHLLEDPNVNGDMTKMLVAYNAGPGNLAKWKKQWEGVEDPLLFIELIPSSQTRTYVERVLSNYWIYRLQENLSVTTLADVADGKPAIYLADADRPMLAYALASR